MSLAASDRIGIAVRTFRIDVDQAHLHGGERVFEIARMHRYFGIVVRHKHGFVLVLFHAMRSSVIAQVAAEPGGLAAPVHVLVRLPGVLAAAGETEGAEAHRLQRDIAGEDQKIGPGNLLAVLLLDRPQQAARLVEVDVVRPGVERSEALLAAAAAAAAVADAVGAGAVPGHADEQRTVVAEVGRPPVLRVGHQLAQIVLQRLVVELLELLAIVEGLAQRIGLGRMLAQQVDAQLVRPPVAVGSCRHRCVTTGICPGLCRRSLRPSFSPIVFCSLRASCARRASLGRCRADIHNGRGFGHGFCLPQWVGDLSGIQTPRQGGGSLEPFQSSSTFDK